MRCEHKDFFVHAEVIRLQDVGAFKAEFRINCKECGLPFEFIGVTAGMSHEKPMASLDAQELRVPIRPKGCKIFPAVAGFEVKAQ